MSAIALHRTSHKTESGIDYQHLKIQITNLDGIVEPQDLATLALPESMIWSQGVVLEGRSPIWVYGYLIHACHPAAWVACFDPRLGGTTPHSGGAVIVATHTRAVQVGQILPIVLPPKEV